jgi:hypothetical protein
MNNFTKFLVNDLLEQKDQKITAIYGGGFKPPTKGHFNVVKQATEQNPEIDDFIIYIGGGTRDNITQGESIQIWDIYKKYLPLKVRIEPVKSPVGDILRYAKEHPEETVLWVIGARENNPKDWSDISARTRTLDKYPNIQLRIIQTQGGVSGTAARKAVEDNDKEQFFKLIPDIEEKEQVWDIVSGMVNEGLSEKHPKAVKFWALYYNIFQALKPNPEERYNVLSQKLKGEHKEALDYFYDEFFKNGEQLNEGKQVGKIYHFTRKDSLKNILNSNKLLGSFQYELNNGKEIWGISTTRNKNLFYDNTDVRITLDGDKISDNYQIIPRDYWGGEYNIPDNPQTIDEDEELIITPKKYIDNINKYILDIYSKTNDIIEYLDEASDPKKGTGKKPKGSSRRLYTDEDPKDTVSIKFKTKEDIVDTLNKTSFKAKSHARQSQIINLIHQRVRAAYGKSKDPEVKSRLKRALDYIEKRKEMSKKKTERLNKMKEASDPQAGTALPYGSGFAPVKENDPFSLNELARQFVNETLKETWRPEESFVSLSQYMIDNGMNIQPLPKIKVIKDDEKNASDLLGKTAYYNPSEKSITLYTMDRHPKDILRSFAHEMVHHEQNLEGRINNINTTNTNEDGDLPEIEKEAYEKGNMMLRNWEDSIKNA